MGEGKTEEPREKPLRAKERTSNKLNSAHIWRRCRDLNTQNIGGRQVLSPLRHPGFHNLKLLLKPTLSPCFGPLATPDAFFLHFPSWKRTKRGSIFIIQYLGWEPSVVWRPVNSASIATNEIMLKENISLGSLICKCRYTIFEGGSYWYNSCGNGCGSYMLVYPPPPFVNIKLTKLIYQ